MANVFSLCNDIEQFLQQNDQNSINEFLHWIKHRLNISPNLDKSMIQTSQIFLCQCGSRYSLRFAIVKDEFNENLLCKRCFQVYNNDQIKSHDCEQRKIDELQSLEQLIPPDIIEHEEHSNQISNSTRLTRFGLPKLTDSLVEIINSDGKRQFRCPLCFNSYVNRSGLNRHYITHSSQDLWKVECQFCGKRYSRKDSLKHHIKTQHTQFVIPNWIWKEKNNLLDIQSNEKEQINNDDVVLVT